MSMQRTSDANRGVEDSAPATLAEITAEEAEQKATWIVRFSIFNPYSVIVMALFIIVIGYVCLWGEKPIPVDLLPAYKTPAVQVLTLYPGMPADIVERDMTNRLERWTSQAEGVLRQESRSMIGVSILKDYFRDDIDPNTAMSQVSALAIADLYYLPPGTIPPMTMLFDPTASLPTALVAASSDTLGEKEVYDLTYFNVRNMLSGTPGVIAPAVFGERTPAPFKPTPCESAKGLPGNRSGRFTCLSIVVRGQTPSRSWKGSREASRILSAGCPTLDPKNSSWRSWPTSPFMSARTLPAWSSRRSWARSWPA
jgi:hypothetical protein